MSARSDRPAVRMEHVSKTYQLGALAGIRQAIHWLSRGRLAQSETFEALHDVSFAVQAGEFFGVVGANGSGKSTILHILSGVTVPTDGRAYLRGTVLPGSGAGVFHPELTGRENVLLFWAMSGRPRAAALQRMAEITEFAEIRRHLDTPVKRYSDGMMARLAFSSAMLFPADIYVFDEVLAFVDAELRERALRAMDDLVAAGRTVLFVSHNMDDMREHAHRVLWMRDGRVHRLGPALEVLTEYEQADEYLGHGLHG